MSKNKKGLILSIIGILGLIVITVGVTYAFFNYVKEGTTENSITSGTITFLYTEVSEVGRGISIEDAYPMSDEIGKVQIGEGKVFDFKITSNTSNSTSIPYEVTARKKKDSTLDENVVKLYLTEVDGSIEEEIVLDNYSNLVQTTRVDSNRYIEKTIYEGKVPVNSINYEKNFRLRMWIDESTDFSAVTDSEGNVTYPYSGKEFTITVNVYANGKVVTEEEKSRKGDSLLSILEEEDLETGYYNFEVNNEIYPVHLYVYDGNKSWKNDKVFGDSNDVANATEDAKNMVIVKVNGDLTIDNEVTVGPYYTEYGGPKGFTLYVTGTLTNNGTIDNSHGARSEGQDVYLWKNTDDTYEYVPAIGATGGASLCGTIAGNPGSNGEGRQTGGGGSAQVWKGCSGAGGTGTSYSGGTGSGGGDKGNGAEGSPNGGSGGNASGSGGGAGGGAGNPGGYPIGNGQKGSNGTGGLLTIYADKVVNNGSITATGVPGGGGNQPAGSSGGGSINIFYHQKMDDRGEITVNGGYLREYEAGGKGSTSIGIIEDGNYIADKNYRRLVWKFDYTGEEQIFTASIEGPYKLEVWGAQGGGSYGGYGGYSTGLVNLQKEQAIYINVGGTTANYVSGYNGGGMANYTETYQTSAFGGGGATHISFSSGLLSNLSEKIKDILVVAGGGGGSNETTYYGGVGGGVSGSNGSGSYYGIAGTQTSGGGTIGAASSVTGSFGQGGDADFLYASDKVRYYAGGGGGGFYGGGGGSWSITPSYSGTGAGGSGYIGNTLLISKTMYCYNCEESVEVSTKTISTTNVSQKPISNYAKQGNGYAKITYLGTL